MGKKKRMVAFIVCVAMAVTLFGGVALAEDINGSHAAADAGDTAAENKTPAQPEETDEGNTEETVAENMEETAGEKNRLPGAEKETAVLAVASLEIERTDAVSAEEVIDVPIEGLTISGGSLKGIDETWLKSEYPNVETPNLRVKIPSGVTEVASNALRGTSGYHIVSVDFSEAASLKVIRSQAFMYNTYLSGELVLPESLKTLEKSAFNGCTGLTGITLPSGLETLGTTDSGSVFNGCSGLLYIKVTDGDPGAVFELPASLKIIGRQSFKECFSSSVNTSVVLPESVEYVGEEAFKTDAITTIHVQAADASAYNGRAFVSEANSSASYALGGRIIVFRDSAAHETFAPSGFSTYKNACTYEFTLQYGEPAVRTEQKLYGQPANVVKNTSGDWETDSDYALPEAPSAGAPVGYTGGWEYDGEIMAADTVLRPSGDLLIIMQGYVLEKPQVVPVIDGVVQDFSDTSFDINVSNDQEHQVGVRVTHPLLEQKDENDGSVYFKYEWTDVWKGGSEGPRMEEEGFGFPGFPSRGTPTIPINGPEHERTHAGEYSGEDYGDGYYLIEIYGYYSRPGKADKLFYKSRHTAIGTADPDATEAVAYIFYVKTSAPAETPEVTVQDISVPYGYSDAAFSADVQEEAGHTYSCQWYQAEKKGQTTGGEPISGAVETEYKLPSGFSVGEYHYYLEVTACKTENGDTASAAVPVTFTVEPAAAIAVPDAGQWKYTGQEDPAYRYTVQGLSEEITISGALSRMRGEQPGSYAYTIGTLAANDENYRLVLAEEAPEFEVVRYEAKAVFSPEIPDGKNGWYRSEVTAAPPERHLISLDGKTWSRQPLLLTEQDSGTFTYYLKSVREDETKDAVAKNTVTLLIDTTAPAIKGCEDGAVYCMEAAFAAEDEHIAGVFVDGEPVSLPEEDAYLLGPGRHTVVVSDEAGNQTELTVTVNAKHTPGETVIDKTPGCTTPGSGHADCIYCGVRAKEIVLEAVGHTYREWHTDAERHWHECTACGEIFDEAPHAFGEWAVVAGRQERTCTVCGCRETKEVPFPANENGGTDTTGGNSSADETKTPKTDDGRPLMPFALLAGAGALLLAVGGKRRHTEE